MSRPARLIRALWDGLRLRCPRCHRGRMFARGFTMNRRCPVCDLLFESASGEVTGGMAINTVLTLTIVMIAALIGGFSPSIPLLPFLLGMGVFAIVFPIVFYRSSRGIWAGFLYVTGDNAEADNARQ